MSRQCFVSEGAGRAAAREPARGRKCSRIAARLNFSKIIALALKVRVVLYFRKLAAVATFVHGCGGCLKSLDGLVLSAEPAISCH